MKSVCFVILVALLCVSGVAAAIDPLDDLFNRGRASQQAIKTLTASFVDTTVSSLLRDPLVSTGTLVAEAPMRVVMQYATPTAKTVALDDTRLVVVWPLRGDREELDISRTQRRVRDAFEDRSARQFRETFDITLSSDKDLNDAHWLTLVPRRKQISQELERLQLWVDRSNVVLVKMKFEYPDGDTKTIELKNIKTNVVLNPDAFAALPRPTNQTLR